MRPIKGNGSQGKRLPGDNDKTREKREAEKSSKVRRHIDSSEESGSENDSGEGSKSKPTIKQQKQSPEKKKMSMAPHSTTYQSEASTDPSLRSSSKRAVFHRKLEEEKGAGIEGRHRRRETDLKGKLNEVQEVPRRKEMESAKSRLDPVKLLEKAKVAGGHLEVKVLSSKDAEVVAKVLKKNPSIRSIKLICDLGGRSFNSSVDIEKLKAALREGKAEPDSLDKDSFENILKSCGHVQRIDLSGCRLSNYSWESMQALFPEFDDLQCLILGNGDFLEYAEAKGFFKRLADISSLRELVLRNTGVNPQIIKSILHNTDNRLNLRTLKLENLETIKIDDLSLPAMEVEDLIFSCEYNYCNVSHLSVAGCKVDARFIDPSLRNYAQNIKSLISLDMTNCGLSEQESDALAAIVKELPALEEIKLEGNEVSDVALASFDETTKRNREANLRKREPAERAATAAYDLLLENAAAPSDTWPRELSHVLAKNSPTETLEALSKLVGENKAPQSETDNSE